MKNTSPAAGTSDLPDWWERERQRRQLIILILLCTVGLLIAYFYWVSIRGFVSVPGIPENTSDLIAFVRQDPKTGNTDLYTVHADGTGLHELSRPDDRSSKSSPAWTNDGKRLLYVSNLKDQRTWQVYILGAGDPEQLTYGTGNKSFPIVNPKQAEIAFITQGSVKTVALNGKAVEQVMPPPAAGNADSNGDQANAGLISDPASAVPGPFITAAYSADGRGIAGVKTVGSEEQAALPPGMNLGNEAAFALSDTTGAAKSVFLATGHDLSVAWDPKSDRVACSFTDMEETIEGKTEAISGITVFSFAGPGKVDRKPLLLARQFTIQPMNMVWSPDGTKLAFECWRSKSEDDRELMGIVVLAADKLPIRPIATKQDGESLFSDRVNREVIRFTIGVGPGGKPGHPLWSPDGSRLLYQVARPDGGNDLWVINGDGTDPINLTKGVVDNTQAAWSPAVRK